MAMDKFPNRLNELRRAAGLSQEQLGNLVGTTKANVGRYENGRQELTISWMERFASALHCDVADLLIDKHNPMRLRDAAEREVITRMRYGGEDRRDDLRRVAETLIPFRPEPRDRNVA